MKKAFFLLAGLVFFPTGQASAEKILGVDGNQKASLVTISKITGVNKMSGIEIADRFQSVDPGEMPTLVPTTGQENLYVRYLINSLLDVFEQKRELHENDAVFGTGTFFWPKDPKKPTKASISYASTNFKLRSISIGLRRPTAEKPWCSGGISVHPRNFPTGIFKMDLTKDFFSEFKFQKAYIERRDDESTKNVNIFLYKSTSKNIDLNLRFEARTDVSDVRDQYPRSFHDLIIDRISADCLLTTSTR